MKSLIILDPPHSANVRAILAKDGYACSIVSLEAGEQLAIERSPRGEEHLLFVLDGSLTVRADKLNTLLGKNEAHVLPKDLDCTIEAAEERPAKFLRVDVPARQIVDAPLYTLEAERG